jgi:ankyrin repeat protein
MIDSYEIGCAASLDVSDVCNLLWDMSDPNERNSDKEASLHILAKRKIDNDYGSIDLEIENKTVHFESCAKGLTLLDALIKNGARVNIRDSQRNTPLHNAVRKGHLEYACYLMTRNADLSAKNLSDKTPLSLAFGRQEGCDCQEMINLFIKKLDAMKDEEPSVPTEKLYDKIIEFLSSFSVDDLNTLAKDTIVNVASFFAANQLVCKMQGSNPSSYNPSRDPKVIAGVVILSVAISQAKENCTIL